MMEIDHINASHSRMEYTIEQLDMYLIVFVFCWYIIEIVLCISASCFLFRQSPPFSTGNVITTRPSFAVMINR